jgi:PQQ-like domain
MTSPADAMIELGDVSTHPQADHGPAWPPELDLRRIGYFALVIVSVLAFVVASVTLPASPLPFVTSLPIGTDPQILVHDSQAFVIDSHSGKGEVSAYALPGGHHDWTTPMAGATSADFYISGALLVTISGLGSGDNALAQGFDLRTGASRWSLEIPGDVGTEALPTGFLLSPDLTEPSGLVQFLNASTGTIRWKETIPNACEESMGSRTALVEVCPDEIRVLDIQTGRVTAQRRVDVETLLGVSSADALTSAFAVGDVVVLAVHGDPDTNVAAFSLNNLAPLWSNLPVTANVDIDACGAHICLIQGQAMVAELDPTTGATVAAPPEPPVQTRSQPQVIGAHVSELVVVPLDRQIMPNTSAPGATFYQVTPEDEAVGLVPSKPDPGNALWISEQIGSGIGATVRPLRRIPDVQNSCTPIANLVACTTSSTRVALYRLP